MENIKGGGGWRGGRREEGGGRREEGGGGNGREGIYEFSIMISSCEVTSDILQGGEQEQLTRIFPQYCIQYTHHREETDR